MTVESIIPDQEDIALERQPPPTGVCLADIQVPPKTAEGHPPDATSRRSRSHATPGL
jgi:hypothetical protein